MNTSPPITFPLTISKEDIIFADSFPSTDRAPAPVVMVPAPDLTQNTNHNAIPPIEPLNEEEAQTRICFSGY